MQTKEDLQRLIESCKLLILIRRISIFNFSQQYVHTLSVVVNNNNLQHHIYSRYNVLQRCVCVCIYIECNLYSYIYIYIYIYIPLHLSP